MIKRAKKIQRLVEQLLDQYNISSPPIDVLSIAKNKGIDIVQGDLGDVSGVLLREGSRITIWVNQNDIETRKRFTIAHEIGHLILHGDEPLHVDKVFAVKLRNQVSSEAVDLGEIEANAFAAELLMPTDMMRQKIQELPGIIDYEKDAVINQLAKEFKVSHQAMTIRLTNLG
jgi:Zn-dependent peptidase ImmA (M78 family)